MLKRVRAARHYQHPKDPVLQLMLKARRPIARALHQVLSNLGDLVPRQRVIDLLNTGRWHQVQYAPDFNHFSEVLKNPFAKIADAYQEGAQHGVRKINASFNSARQRVRFRKGYGNHFIKAANDAFNFDMFDAATQQRLRVAQDELIQQLIQDARDTIETVVMDGALQGLSASEIVDDVRAVIGLTDRQAQAVLNYRRMLEDLDSGALQRQLRNTDFDTMVSDAIASGEALAQAQIDSMVSDYTENYLTYRASMIAQTESVRATSAGLSDAYQQAIDRGAIPESAVKRFWQLGDSPCPICESIPDNNPDGVSVGQSFMSDEGPVDDPPVHPNCMCSVDYVTDISQVPAED